MPLGCVALDGMRAYQEGGNADELQLGPAHLLLLQIAVDDVHSHIKRLGDHLEFEVDLDLCNKRDRSDDMRRFAEKGLEHSPASQRGCISSFH